MKTALRFSSSTASIMLQLTRKKQSQKNYALRMANRYNPPAEVLRFQSGIFYNINTTASSLNYPLYSLPNHSFRFTNKESLSTKSDDVEVLQPNTPEFTAEAEEESIPTEGLYAMLYAELAPTPMNTLFTALEEVIEDVEDTFRKTTTPRPSPFSRR